MAARPEDCLCRGLAGFPPARPLATKADDLSGQVMAREGELPPIWEELSLELELLEKMVSGDDIEGGIRPLQPNEMLMVNSATATSVGTVANIKGRRRSWPSDFRFVPRREAGSPFPEGSGPDGG